MAQSTTLVPPPLKGYEKIGFGTYLYTPPSFGPESPLLLFFSWMGAADKHIAKYTATYPQILGSCRILLVRNETKDFFRSDTAYEQLLAPALDVVREHVQHGGEILIHSASNGGANQLIQFSKLYKKTTGTVLPSRAQIFDSGPGLGGYSKSHRAIYLGLPRGILFRLFGSLLVHGFLISIFIYRTLLRKPPIMVILRRRLNDPRLFDLKAPRVYLYSKKDEVVGDEEVAQHADDAEKEGWKVRKVLFQNSPHVGHIREDEQKYWGAIADAWNGV